MEQPKPDKAAYSFALTSLDEDAQDCVAVEDNVEGVEAAAAAGVKVVAFPNENTTGHDFARAERRVDHVEFGSWKSFASDCPMVEPRPTFLATETAFHVEAYEKIDFSLVYVDGAFAVGNDEIAASYRGFGRCLMVADETVLDLYGAQIQTYFDHYQIDLTVFPVMIKETDKTLRTLEQIVDAFDAFGLVRTEPVLVVGGGLTTDVAGLACATYRRRTDYIRVPTTLIGLIDASVAIKVAVNHGRSKNRLGAFHPSQKVVLDFSFLKTLSTDQVRNGMAELFKIAAVANADIFALLETYGDALLRTRFGYLGGTTSCARSAAGSPMTRSTPC